MLFPSACAAFVPPPRRGVTSVRRHTIYCAVDHSIWEHAGPTMEGLVDDFQVFNKGAAMFEAEIEMERRSSFLPLLLMMCLVAAIVGLAGYVIFQVRGKTPVSAQQASVVVAMALEERGPAVIHF